jgi:anti-sigma regulatory factor (Ser/Thr protein kinase)
MNGEAHFSASFDSDEYAPRAARSEIAERLRELGFDGDFELIVLLASEVVTNAVVHAPGSADAPIELTGDLKGTSLRLSVTNAGPPFAWSPVRLPHAGPHGRGLALVDGNARAWGVAHDHGTTCVWFEVDERAAA